MLPISSKVDHDGYIGQSNTSGNPSIARTCFDRKLESASRGFDENVVRATTGTIFLGKGFCGPQKMQNLNNSLLLAAVDTVR